MAGEERSQGGTQPQASMPVNMRNVGVQGKKELKKGEELLPLVEKKKPRGQNNTIGAPLLATSVQASQGKKKWGKTEVNAPGGKEGKNGRLVGHCVHWKNRQRPWKKRKRKGGLGNTERVF